MIILGTSFTFQIQDKYETRDLQNPFDRIYRIIRISLQFAAVPVYDDDGYAQAHSR
jgi:hypothetical protein